MTSTLMTTPVAIPDVQAQADLRGVRLDRVGVRRVRYPVLLDTPRGSQSSIAEWELTVDLEPERRGTHMSRFLEMLEQHRDRALDGWALLAMLDAIRGRLDASEAHARCTFPMFIERAAPVTELSARHAVDCCYTARVSNSVRELELGVRAAITTLCPCSKEISEYGAHNQRGYVDITARVCPGAGVGLTELIAIGEASGSAVIYPLLKRADERYVTMQAYDSPTFVEDVVRNAALSLAAEQRILSFRVEAENYESIHDHSAVAAVTWERP